MRKFEKVKKYFDTTGSKAAVVRFQHQKPDDPKQEETIRRYEEYLLSTAEKMAPRSIMQSGYSPLAEIDGMGFGIPEARGF